MFALINRQEMTLLCTFTDIKDLLPEHLDAPYDTFVVNEESLENFTTLELKLFYRNMGQVLGTVMSNRKSIVESVLKMIRYKVPSSPSQVGIFDTTVEPAKEAEVPVDRDRDVVNARTLSANNDAPKGGKRAIIWEVADLAWEAAGKPIDITKLLALRKEIMTTLETQHNVKRTTSSTALGEWQKVRCFSNK